MFLSFSKYSLVNFQKSQIPSLKETFTLLLLYFYGKGDYGIQDSETPGPTDKRGSFWAQPHFLLVNKKDTML